MSGPLGLSSMVRAAGLGGDACGEGDCPCDESEADHEAEPEHGAELEHEADAEHECDAEHGERSGHQCPPGCHDCGCCTGVLFAITPSAAPPLVAPATAPLTRAGPDRVATGVYPRPFRPPRHRR